MLRSFRGEPESPRGWAPSQERGTGRQGAGGGPGTEGTQGAGAAAQGVGAAVLGVARGGAPRLVRRARPRAVGECPQG